MTVGEVVTEMLTGCWGWSSKEMAQKPRHAGQLVTAWQHGIAAGTGDGSSTLQAWGHRTHLAPLNYTSVMHWRKMTVGLSMLSVWMHIRQEHQRGLCGSMAKLRQDQDDLFLLTDVQSITGIAGLYCQDHMISWIHLLLFLNIVCNLLSTIDWLLLIIHKLLYVFIQKSEVAI